MKAARGFSLLELMIAVAIVGILAAVAIPSYKNQLVKGNRAAAQAMLMEVAQKEQQYLLDARTYLASTNCAGLSALGISVDTRVSQNYTCVVTTVAGPPPTFSAKASPIAGTRQEGDGDIIIDNLGNKSRGSTPTW